MNPQVLVQLIDLVLAVDSLLMNHKDVLLRWSQKRNRVIDIYRAAKDRELTQEEQAELAAIREALISERNSLITQYDNL